MNASNFIRPVFAGLTLLWTAGCDKPESAIPPPPPPEDNTLKVSYPVEREIRDNQNRPLDGWIVGKTPGQIYVVRKADKMEFKISFERLGAEDRAYAERLPIQVPPADFQLTQTTAPPTPSPSAGDSPYVENRRKTIKRLQDEIDILTQEITSTSNQMVVRTKESQIEKMQLEIGQLEADIMRYEQNNPNRQE